MLSQLGRTRDASLYYGDVDLIVTRYHIEQARTRRRRERSRATASRRALARRTTLDAAFEAAKAIGDAEQRLAELARLEKSAETSRKMARQAAAEREMVRRRMRVGFENTHHVEVGGRVRAPFVERGLRSDRLGNAGKLFVRGCRKARFLRTANEKGFITVQHGRKVLNLDYAWVEGNREMVSLIRIDLDRCFLSFDELRGLLQELVDAGKLPCMPHLVVGDVAPLRISERQLDGTWRDRHVPHLIRPHLWFLLPKAVNMGPNGRDRPKRILEAVSRGLCNVLLPLGADPNAATLLVRGKNPLSPWWQSECFNDDAFPSLSEYASRLGKAMKASREQMSRQAAEMQSGLAPKVSNEFYTAASAEAWRLLREMHQRQDTEYLAALADRDGLMRALLSRLMPMESVLLLGDGLVEPQRGAYVLDKVISYAAARWNPARADAAVANSGRGRMSHLVAKAGSLKEAQAISGKAVASERMQQARKAVSEAMDAVERSGAPFTQAEVARASGLNRKTVARHWRFCEARRPGRCVDKKGGLNPGMDDVPPAPDRKGAAADGATVESSAVRNRKAPVPRKPFVVRDSESAAPEPVVAVRQTNPLPSGTALRLARKASAVRDVQAYVSGPVGAAGTPSLPAVAHREACPANPPRVPSSPVLPPLFTIRNEGAREAEAERRKRLAVTEDRNENAFGHVQT